MGSGMLRIRHVLQGVLILCLSLVIVQGYVVEEEQSDLRLGKEKVTRLRFFLQATGSGKKQTAFNIARPSTVLPFSFGNLIVVDDVLTAAVSRSSKVVGSAQGFYALTGLSNLSAVIVLDFGFTSGKYKGSAFVVVSRDPVSEATRELAVVGGRGQFRLARGFAIVATRSLADLNFTLEFNVTLLHY